MKEYGEDPSAPDANRCQELEHENRHLRRELARASARGRENPAPETRKLELIGRLVSGLSHEFNNVLSVVMANASMMEDAELDAEERRECVDNILLAGEQGSMLMQRLLTFARQREMRPRVVQLNQVVDSVERFLRLLAGSRMRFDSAYADDAGAIEVDPHQLEQVLMNLVVNAREACREQGTLKIRTGRFTTEHPVDRAGLALAPGTYAFIAVSDDGPGIPGEVLANVFEPFFTTKGQGRGAGLGLATVRALVEQNRGHIALSTGSGGTTFELLFASADPNAIVEPGEPPACPRARQAVVLLVEDDDIVRGALASVLERRGFTVLSANSGQHALAMLDDRGQDVDVLLTDIMLPGPRGTEVARRFRRRFPGRAILLMTGYAPDAATWPADLRGVEVLTKPVLPAQLVHAIRGQLMVERVA